MSVIDRLLENPQRFDLFQAISLLERAAPDAVPVGSSVAWQEREAVRLSAHISMGFQPSDVRAVLAQSRTGEPFTLQTPLLSLAGEGGPLPLPFTEMVLERMARRDHATADFLDIFNHRLLAFLYRGRKKHHMALHAQAPAQSSWVETLDALSALGIREGVRAPDGTSQWLGHAGLLSGAPRSMAGLQAILQDRLGVKVRGRQFVGGWRPLETSALTFLGGRPGVPAARLGGASVLGRRVWDQAAGLQLSFDGLPLSRLHSLLPGGADHAQTHWLVRRYLPQDLEVHMALTLAPKEAHASTLAAKTPMRLGWTSWLAGRAHRGALPTVKLKLTSATCGDLENTTT